jgi:hypothetical protein
MLSKYFSIYNSMLNRLLRNVFKRCQFTTIEIQGESVEAALAT